MAEFKIDVCRYEELIIDHESYFDDLMILSDGSIAPWPRKEEHSLSEADLQMLLDLKPKIIIIGTGWHQKLTVTNELRDSLKAKYQIDLIACHTSSAVGLLNQRFGDGIVAAFHLSC